MRLSLLLLVGLLWGGGTASAQCLPPACVNNIAGTVLQLASGPAAVQLVQAVPGPTINLATDYLAFSWDPLETAQDATTNGTLPCPPPHADVTTCSRITPTAQDAARMTIRIAVGLCRDPACEIVGMNSPTVASPAVIMGDNITCNTTPAECWTPPLGRILPNLGVGGTFRVVLSREALPRFHESGWSEPVIFTVPVGGGDPPPPPPACSVSEWQEWSPWTPFSPQVVPPMETRHRNRTITNQPCLGTPLLTEVANRPVLVTPPVQTCTYMAPLSQVVQQKNIGDVIEGNNYSAQGRGQRQDQLYSWGFSVYGFPIRDQFGTGVHLKATCVGLP